MISTTKSSAEMPVRKASHTWKWLFRAFHLAAIKNVDRWNHCYFKIVKDVLMKAIQVVGYYTVEIEFIHRGNLMSFFLIVQVFLWDPILLVLECGFGKSGMDSGVFCVFLNQFFSNDYFFPFAKTLRWWSRDSFFQAENATGIRWEFTQSESWVCWFLKNSQINFCIDLGIGL